MKRIMAMLIATLFVFSLAACGNESKSGDDNQSNNATVSLEDLEWENTDGGIKITKYKGNAAHIVIPDVIENKKVVSIGKTFTGNVILETIVLSKYIEKVDGSQFKNCDSLKRLEGPGVKSINEFDYGNLDGLEELILPSIKQFDLREFNDLASLRYLEIPNAEVIKLFTGQYPDQLFLWPDTLEEVVISSELLFRPDGREIVDGGYEGYHGASIKSRLKFPDGSEGYEFNYGHDFIEITAENAADIYCNFFQTDTIIVNGVTYKIG